MQARILNNNRSLVNRGFPILIFLASFLSFSVQPFFSKLLLPHFGGSSMVWTSSSLFFQSVLLLSYTYVFILERLQWKKLLFIHSLVGLCVIILAFSAINDWSFSLTRLPILVELPVSTPEWLRIASIGAQSIGLAFFFLGTVSTFLQVFAANQGIENPYLFYRASNLGSFAGLFSYPLLIEPFIRSENFMFIWSALFGVLAVLLVGIFVRFLFLESQTLRSEKNTPPTRQKLLIWSGLAAYPVALFLSVTNQLTIGVAPIPYLWTLPFGLYLLSYSIGFGKNSVYGLPLLASLSLGMSSLLSTLKVTSNLLEYVSQSSILLLATFFFSLLFHSRAYSLRPNKSQLGYFYLSLAFGGVIGGLFVSVFAPLYFKTYFELELLFTIGILFALFFYYKVQPVEWHFAHKRFALRASTIARFLLASYLLFISIKILLPSNGDVLFRSRSFYGTLRVVEYDNSRSLLNGTILHGNQFFDERSALPTSYYGPSSGVGQTINYFRDKRELKPLSIGIIGLGVGNLAAYCLPQDSFVFYEINEQVVDVASNYFTYLKQCKGATVRLGDARKVIATEMLLSDHEKFDLLVIDAFTDDAIPTHLLTLEAGRIYLSRIAEDGALVYHVSNRYLELDRVIRAFAEQAALYSRTLESSEMNLSAEEDKSLWVVVTSSQEDANAIAKEFPQPRLSGNTELWTDDFSNLFVVMKFD